MTEDNNNGVKRELKEHDRIIVRHDQSIGVLYWAAAIQVIMVIVVVGVLLAWVLWRH